MMRVFGIRPPSSQLAALVALFVLIGAAPTDAGQALEGGPSPPAFPETMARDESGNVTLRAARLMIPLRIDGQLDEAVYREVQPATGFIQTDPKPGAPATEKTELWIFFDRNNIYVTARLWESQPERMVANEMRRDSTYVYDSETLSFILDTFYDRRNAVGFIINPVGGRADGQITNGRWTRDWNTIWDFGVRRFEGGWTLEAAIPFKSLRYRPGADQVWGFNARRVDKWKNEVSHLTPTPAGLGGNGLFRISLAAPLVGLEVPPGSKNLEIKPSVVSNLTTDRLARPQISNDVTGDVGVDVKYGVTQNLTADFTYNTDFAQVEADEQQVNLTRFSLFFPEKREFFLENAGLFTFGGAAISSDGVPTGDTPLLFYSRRIGLNQGRVVPIDGGGRLIGRIGRYSMGLVNIQTGAESTSDSVPTNFSVVRLKRDVLRKSSVGLIATGRSVRINGSGSNMTYGADGLWSFYDNFDINTYWARTRTDGVSREDTSYRGQLAYGGDRYGVDLERLVVGDNFNPEVGFVRRDDMQRTAGSLRFSPRPRASKSVRKYSWTGSMAYIENGAGRVETRETEGAFGIELNSGDRFNARYARTYEFLPRPFRIAPGIVLPIGGYDSDNMRASYTMGTQRQMSGNLTLEYGSFYSGHRAALGFRNSRIEINPHLSVEPMYSINRVHLIQGDFTTHLVGSRVTNSMTPQMFASALLQYNSTNHTVAANVRLRWEYAPGSELFVVYNEERDTLPPRFPELANRSFIIKVNRLLRF
jgi:hypothetical protein